MLWLREVGFSYPAQAEVLSDITFSVPAGQRIGLVGQNGSGKSTLFSLLSGLNRPCRGEIGWDDQPYRYDKAGLNAIRQRIGYVFQEADAMLLTPGVYEELSFGPLNLKLDTPEVVRRIEAVSHQLGITQLHDKATFYLSGGEKKLVSLGAILTMQPEIILADEPTGFIDGRHSRLLEDKLMELNRQGRTVIVSSHDMDFVWRFAERVIVLDEGRIVFDGSREELFHQPDILAQAHLNRPHLLAVSQLLHRLGKLAPERLLYDLSELEEW